MAAFARAAQAKRTDENMLELSALSHDQQLALETLLAWVKKPNSPSMTLGGYAGTGKTSLISLLRRQLHEQNPLLRVAFVAFTGKASHVLRQTLDVNQAMYPQDRCSTIHALLYSPFIDQDGRLLGWSRSKDIEADLLIVDEASMVTFEIWADLLQCKLPIIAVGDHGQLPPIGGSFNLMLRPDLRLEEIHRQAQDNPIIALAHEARMTGSVSPGNYSKRVRKFSHATHEPDEINDVLDHLFSNYHEDMLILCGRNTTRVKLNQRIRAQQGIESEQPETGEKVVCLKNIYDNPLLPIYNGMVGNIESLHEVGPHWYETEISFPEDETRSFSGNICRPQFNHLTLVEKIEGLDFKQIGARFDFGYALTVHKAQGSQAKTVLLFEERFQKSDDEQWRRWLYTAITRARENLYIVGA